MEMAYFEFKKVEDIRRRHSRSIRLKDIIPFSSPFLTYLIFYEDPRIM
jgi:hypothetical protein